MSVTGMSKPAAEAVGAMKLIFLKRASHAHRLIALMMLACSASYANQFALRVFL